MYCVFIYIVHSQMISNFYLMLLFIIWQKISFEFSMLMCKFILEAIFLILVMTLFFLTLKAEGSTFSPLRMMVRVLDCTLALPPNNQMTVLPLII